MKKLFSVLMLMMMLVTIQAQEVMKIELKNGTISEFQVENINKVYFDKSNNNQNDNVSKILGVWWEAEYWKNNQWNSVGIWTYTWFYEFREDGKFYYYNSKEDLLAGKPYDLMSGTYTFDGTYIVKNGGFPEKVDFSQDGNTLRWENNYVLKRYNK